MTSTLLTCDSLNENGKRAIETLVQLSHEYGFSVLFYRAPINEDFYIFSNTTPANYAKCSELLAEYFAQLIANNPNVFFSDLSQYKEIARGKELMYRDAHHLTTAASVRLLDALSPQIEAALEWARTQRP